MQELVCNMQSLACTHIYIYHIFAPNARMWKNASYMHVHIICTHFTYNLYTYACMLLACILHAFCSYLFLLIQILIHTCIFVSHTRLQSCNVISLCSDPVFLSVQHSPAHRMLHNSSSFLHLLVTCSGCLSLFFYLFWRFGYLFRPFSYLFRLFSFPSYLLGLFIFHLLLV